MYFVQLQQKSYQPIDCNYSNYKPFTVPFQDLLVSQLQFTALSQFLSINQLQLIFKHLQIELSGYQ
jgi:hypothetical protein